MSEVWFRYATWRPVRKQTMHSSKVQEVLSSPIGWQSFDSSEACQTSVFAKLVPQTTVREKQSLFLSGIYPYVMEMTAWVRFKVCFSISRQMGRLGGQVIWT